MTDIGKRHGLTTKISDWKDLSREHMNDPILAEFWQSVLEQYAGDSQTLGQNVLAKPVHGNTVCITARRSSCNIDGGNVQPRCKESKTCISTRPHLTFTVSLEFTFFNLVKSTRRMLSRKRKFICKNGNTKSEVGRPCRINFPHERCRLLFVTIFRRP